MVNEYIKSGGYHIKVFDLLKSKQVSLWE